MMTALLILVVVVVVLGLTLVVGLALGRRYVVERPYDEVRVARTEDGWRLALHRYRGEVGPERPPILLCHGVGANRCNVDLDDERSLAAALHADGRDVWLLDLRGAGASDRADPRAGRRPGWTFDDHVAYDAPAALALVRKVTGVDAIDWVGFSMGGLVAYAFFGAAGGAAGGSEGGAAGPANADDALPRLRRLVTIGSPVPTRPGGALGILGVAGTVMRPFARTPLEGPARATAFAVGPLYRLAGGPIGVRGGTTKLALARAMVNVVADISRGVSQQLRDWIRTGRFASEDGAVDYAAGLARITVPTLVLGGAADRLAPPHTVEAAFERLGSQDKRLVLLGPEHGHRQAYGHADLAFGHHAREEVYPLVVEWLRVEGRGLRVEGRGSRVEG